MEKNQKNQEKSNLSVYEQMRSCPENALRKIQSGRLTGKSDINPMWRLKKMTEVFGICGIGWRYSVTKMWTESYGTEVKSFVNIDLFVRDPETKEWSEAIPGTGGSSFVAKEKGGAHVSDECYKMALTDALSVSMKALGMAADVYFAADADLGTKYSQQESIAQGTDKPVTFTEDDAVAEMKRCKTKDEIQVVWDRYSQYHAQGSKFYNATVEQGMILNR